MEPAAFFDLRATIVSVLVFVLLVIWMVLRYKTKKRRMEIDREKFLIEHGFVPKEEEKKQEKPKEKQI
jgi:membrane protein YdbS with pleckstrin-like domain